MSALRRTAMHRAQAAVGARFREEAAWLIADVYRSADEEARATRAAVGLADVSAMAKLAVRGADATTALEKLAGQQAPAAGRATRARFNGAEATVCRVAPDELLVLAAPAAQGPILDLLAPACQAVGCAHVSDVTSGYAAVDLVGPRSPAVLERLAPLDLGPAAFPVLAVARGELAHVRAIFLRLDHRELPAIRVLVPRECGAFVWRALGEAGHDLGLACLGAAAHARLLEER